MMLAGWVNRVLSKNSIGGGVRRDAGGRDDESSDMMEPDAALVHAAQISHPMFAGWISRHQLDVTEFLREENRVLKERLGGRRLRFTDAERAGLPERRKHSDAKC